MVSIQKSIDISILKFRDNVYFLKIFHVNFQEFSFGIGRYLVKPSRGFPPLSSRLKTRRCQLLMFDTRLDILQPANQLVYMKKI